MTMHAGRIEAAVAASIPPRRDYVPELDGLRAIAAILVILFHSDPAGMVSGGFVGVDIFFVLSAYLITSILVAEKAQSGTIRFGRFYVRRALRLMPAFLLFLAAYVLVAPWIWPGHPHGRDALIAGAYVSNFTFAEAQVPAYLSHSWSLAAEEQFYLFWPVLLVALLHTRHRVATLAAAWAALTWLRLSWNGEWQGYYYGLLPHGSGLVLGAMLYFAVRDHGLRLTGIHAATGGVMIASQLAGGFIADSAASIMIAETGAALVIGAIACGNTGGMGLLATPLLRTLGKLSYGLYLWHYPIAVVVRDHFDLAATFAITFAMSLAAAAASYWTVEAWGRRMNARHRPAEERLIATVTLS